MVRTLFARIPTQRVGVLIGPKGGTKKRIEEATGVKIFVDSEAGEVTIGSGQLNPPEVMKVKDVVTAIGRGFSETRAMRLLEEDVYLKVINIRDYSGKSKKRLREIKGRLIGSQGKTRRLVEELTGADVSVYGNTVSIIGDPVQLDVAGRAVKMVLEGSEHSTVYRFLERKRAEIKVYELGL